VEAARQVLAAAELQWLPEEPAPQAWPQPEAGRDALVEPALVEPALASPQPAVVL
jgi:hypothetical protein